MNELSTADYRKLIEMAPVLCVDLILKTAVNGKYVLFKRCNDPLRGEWWVVGGRVSKGEHPRAAACRKVLEEVGIDLHPEDVRFVGYYQEVFEFSSVGRGSYHAVSLVFEAIIDPSKIELDAQHDEWTLSDRLPIQFEVTTP